MTIATYENKQKKNLCHTNELSPAELNLISLNFNLVLTVSVAKLPKSDILSNIFSGLFEI